MFWRFSSRAAYRSLREGRLDSALNAFQSLHQRFPRSPIPFFEIGKLEFKKGNLPGARDAFHAALDRSANDAIRRGILDVTNWWMISSPTFFNSAPHFSPDGKKLLFCSARQDTNGDGNIDANDRAGIYCADLETAVVREIASNAHHHSAPQWSPDGGSMMFLTSRRLGPEGEGVDDPKHQHLVLRDAASGDETLLVPASLSPRHPVFTPDGKQVIVCTVDSVGGPSGLSVVDIATQQRKPLTSHAWEHTFPQASPDGRSVMYVSWRQTGSAAPHQTLEGHPAIYLLDLASGQERTLVNNQFSNAFPRFSPEGDRVLFLSRRHDTNGDGRIDHLDNFAIYSIRLSDRNLRCVSPDDHYNKFASWSPDGRTILFLGHWAAEKSKPAGVEDYFEFKGIYKMAAQGGRPETIVSDQFYGSRYCEVAPKGNLVAYVSWRPRGNRGLYIADYVSLPTRDQLHSFIQNNLS